MLPTALGHPPGATERAGGLTCCEARLPGRHGISVAVSVIRAKEERAPLRLDVSAHVALLRWLQGRNSTRREVHFAAAVFLIRSVRVLSHSCGTIRLRRCSTEMTRGMRGALCETVSFLPGAFPMVLFKVAVICEF